MNLKQLRKLVVETVREEQTKGVRKQQKTPKRNWNNLVENAIANVLREGNDEDDQASEDPQDPQAPTAPAESQPSEEQGSGDWNEVVVGATKLGGVDVAKAKELLQMENPQQSDAIPVGPGGGSAQQLMPTQSSMNLKKATHFALGMLNGTMYGSGGPGGDLGAFLCNNYLLDGHHRWVATCMVAPGANVKGYEIKGIEAEDAVKVLNVATAAFMGHNQGKGGAGSFKDFEDSGAILAKLKECDADDVTSVDEESGEEKVSTGVPKVNGAGNATKICEQWAAGELSQSGINPASRKEGPVQGEEALEWAAQMMAQNCAKTPGVSDASVLIPGNVRADMPVADDPEHAGAAGGTPMWGKDQATQGVVDALSTGKLDLKESIDLGRWNKLAGLLKD